MTIAKINAFTSDKFRVHQSECWFCNKLCDNDEIVFLRVENKRICKCCLRKKGALK